MKKRFLILTTLGIMAMSTMAGCGNNTDSSSSAASKIEVSVDDAKAKTNTKTESTKTESKAEVTDESVLISFFKGIDKTVVVKDAKADDLASNFKDETGIVKKLAVKKSTVDASKVGEYKVTYTATVYADAFDKAVANVKDGKDVAKYTAKADDKTKDISFDVTVKVVTEDDAKNLKDVLIINKDGKTEEKDLTQTTAAEATKTDASNSSTSSKSTSSSTTNSNGSSSNGSSGNKASTGNSANTNSSTGSGSGGSGSSSGSSSSGASNSGTASGGSSSDTGSQTAAHTHNWQPIYTTVHHDAVYTTVHHDAVTHQEQVKVGENPILEDHVFCDCGTNISYWSSDEIEAHQEQCGYLGSYSELVQVGTEPIYETQTVTDQAAYDEQVVVQAAYDEQIVSGYSCSCGATK